MQKVVTIMMRCIQDSPLVPTSRKRNAMVILKVVQPLLYSGFFPLTISKKGRLNLFRDGTGFSLADSPIVTSRIGVISAAVPVKKLRVPCRARPAVNLSPPQHPFGSGDLHDGIARDAWR